MKDSTRQKYMDAMNRRADLIQQADDAFSSGEVEKGKELTTSAAALNPEIEGYQALLAQEEKFAAPRPAPLDRETRERAEDRAETLKNGGRITFSPWDLRSATAPPWAPAPWWNPPGWAPPSMTMWPGFPAL